MKCKVDLYHVYNKGKLHKVIVFPRIEDAWAFDDYPEDDQLMVDGCPEFMRQVQFAMGALINDPSIIAYFPIKHKNCTIYGAHMTYDAVMMRPEVQFKCGHWYDIKPKLDMKHWVGKYTINYDEKKLDDLFEKKYSGKHWNIDYDNVKYHLIGDTAFFTIPKSMCILYETDINDSIKTHTPDKDYGTFCNIGYIVNTKMSDTCKSW